MIECCASWKLDVRVRASFVGRQLITPLFSRRELARPEFRSSFPKFLFDISCRTTQLLSVTLTVTALVTLWA